MMREKDETRKTVESSSAFEDVAWVLQQMVQVLRDRQGRENQGRQGRSDQHEEGEDENDDPNERPTKR
jgi:hypothetical protein